MGKKKNKVTFTKEYLDSVQKFSFGNATNGVPDDAKCFCFYCEALFEAKEAEVLDDVDDEKTLLCPNCGIDSVIIGNEDHPATKELAKAMRKRFFKPL